MISNVDLLGNATICPKPTSSELIVIVKISSTFNFILLFGYSVSPDFFDLIISHRGSFLSLYHLSNQYGFVLLRKIFKKKSLFLVLSPGSLPDWLEKRMGLSKAKL